MLSRYMEMLRMQREPVIANPVLTYDLAPVDTVASIIRADVECESVDATVSFHPGSAQPFAFTDEETGYALDTTGIREGIEQDIQRLAPGSMTLEPQVIEPKVYRTELENSIFLRGHVTAQLEGGEAAVNNITLAAQKINGLCVEPGETLSFNEAVGARTQEGGYLSAPEPAYGEDVSGVGGGS